jgi:hypothetical protein
MMIKGVTKHTFSLLRDVHNLRDEDNHAEHLHFLPEHGQ